MVERLTALDVTQLGPGLHGDGDGLYLAVGRGGGRSWVFRYTRPSGKVGDYGLGGVKDYGLSNARDRAADLRNRRRRCREDGVPFDPIAERQAKRVVEAPKAMPAVPTFQDCAEKYLALNSPTWRNAKHRQQWTNTLATYVHPKIGAVPVNEVTTAQITDILQPMWLDKHETASRVRGRIEVVLDWATPQYRQGDNPARLRLLKLPKRKQVRKVRPVVHHPAMPFSDVPAFVAELRARIEARESISTKALLFTVLVASRTNETLGTTWPELDLDAAVWTLSAERMKAMRDHRVPLSPPVVELLRELKTESDGSPYVFGRGGVPMSENAMLKTLALAGGGDVTVHGFRSSFRDWAAETTSFQGEVVEMALAHAVGDETEAAYRRGELFKKRRELMDAWAGYLDGPRTGNVVPMNRRAAD